MLVHIVRFLVFLLTAFTTSTFAAPAPLPVPQQNSQVSGVYVCRDADWKGPCDHKIERLGSDNCITLDGQTTAFGPDPGFLCTLFTNGICRTFTPDDSLTLQHPGQPNLGRYNDRILSYSCVATQTNGTAAT